MRFLADENFPASAVEALVAAGHDVFSVQLVVPGAQDRDVLALAVRQERVLLTFDKDFGELAAKSALPAICGVVLFRIPAPKTTAQVRKLKELIVGRNDWAGHFSVVGPGRVRMRRIT